MAGDKLFYQSLKRLRAELSIGDYDSPFCTVIIHLFPCLAVITYPADLFSSWWQ